MQQAAFEGAKQNECLEDAPEALQDGASAYSLEDASLEIGFACRWEGARRR